MGTPPRSLEQLAAQIKQLSELISAEKASDLTASRAKSVRKTLSEAYEKLRQLVADLDPIKHPGFVFDPSNPGVAGRVAGIAMIAQPRKPLMNVDRFYGSGIYALYYNGKFRPYKSISGREHPIYVGKADPADPASKTALGQGDTLANRLNDHRRNIAKATSNLRSEDFEYRALVVQTGWQGSAEDYLIHLFKPIWNSQIGICYGFGKHGDSPETRANLRSPWDTLHPGREWAHRDRNMKDAKPEKQIVAEITEHFAKYPPVGTIHEILRRFLVEMRAVS